MGNFITIQGGYCFNARQLQSSLNLLQLKNGSKGKVCFFTEMAPKAKKEALAPPKAKVKGIKIKNIVPKGI